MEKLTFVKDLVKLVVLVILFSIFGISCVDDSNKYYLKDGSTSVSYIKKCRFEEHDYLLFCNGAGDGKTLGVTHDPNCKKCSYERQYRRDSEILE